MNHREQLLILAAIAALVILAILFPRPAASDVSVVAGAVPQSEFVPVKGGLNHDRISLGVATPGLRLAGQGDPSGDKSPRRLAEARTQEAIDGMPEVRIDPLATATVAPRPSADPLPTPVLGVRMGRQVAGVASWFRSPAGVSAAGPALRTALGPGWRGSRVRVTGPAGSAVTVLGDWMRADRLIDLDDDVFPAVCGPLSRGICRVEVSR